MNVEGHGRIIGGGFGNCFEASFVMLRVVLIVHAVFHATFGIQMAKILDPCLASPCLAPNTENTANFV